MPNYLVENSIYDIYVIKTSGIPLFAGCTASDYCKTHMGQHELISGFLSALFSFSKETFAEDTLETMLYGEIMLNFHYDSENELIFIFLHDRNSDISAIRQKLTESRNIFVNNYEGEINRMLIDQVVFQNYRDMLREAGIIPDQLLDTSGMMEPVPEYESSKPNLFKWVKRLFA